MNKEKVLLIGWNPNSVDYSKYPGLTPEKLRGALENDLQKLNDLSYDAHMGYIDSKDTAVDQISALISKQDFDIILIGAGVRNDPTCFHLFENLVNAVHQHASKAKICFNTGPTDNVEAVQRWSNN